MKFLSKRANNLNTDFNSNLTDEKLTYFDWEDIRIYEDDLKFLGKPFLSNEKELKEQKENNTEIVIK